MEYQFIKDPIDGFRLTISDEQTNIARWLVEETGINSQAVEAFIHEICSISNKTSYDYEKIGSEMVLKLSNGEVLVSVSHIAVSDSQIDRFEQEMLSLDSSSDISGCGLDDFIDLLKDWHLFLKDNRA
jgi:uncharacterized protein YacL (UPF0231 family)